MTWVNGAPWGRGAEQEGAGARSVNCGPILWDLCPADSWKGTLLVPLLGKGQWWRTGHLG